MSVIYTQRNQVEGTYIDILHLLDEQKKDLKAEELREKRRKTFAAKSWRQVKNGIGLPGAIQHTFSGGARYIVYTSSNEIRKIV